MPLLEWPTQLGVIGRGEFRMKQETAEDMLEFAKEICQKYSRVKTLAEETQMQWRQDLEMAADSKYPGEKDMYDKQAEEDLARYTALREWLRLSICRSMRRTLWMRNFPSWMRMIISSFSRISPRSQLLWNGNIPEDHGRLRKDIESGYAGS